MLLWAMMMLSSTAAFAKPAMVFIAPEPDRTWLLAVPPEATGSDDEPLMRIALCTQEDAEANRKLQPMSAPARPRVVAAFRDRFTDRWGLCLLTGEGMQWLDGARGRTVTPPPLATIHAAAASETLLYVLGDSIVSDGEKEQPGKMVVLIFTGRLWRQWPHPLPGPTRADGRVPKLVALADGFALMYFRHRRWLRYDCRDGRVTGPITLAETNAPPASARLLGVEGGILAIDVDAAPAADELAVRITRLEDGQWQAPTQLELAGFSPAKGDTSAFAVCGKRLWAIFSDADKGGKAHYGSMNVGARKLTLREAADLVTGREPPPQINSTVLITVGILGLILLLIWRRGARDARWLVRASALPVAPWGRRIVAGLVDLLPAVLISSGVFGEGWARLAVELQAPDPQLSAGSWWAIASLLGIYLLHTTFSELATRATLGKRLMNLTVVDERGRPARRGQILVRNLFRAADLVPILLLGMLLTRYRQRIGDLLAKTVVALKKPPAAEPESDADEDGEPPPPDDSP